MWPGINELKSTSRASARRLWRCQPCLSQSPWRGAAPQPGHGARQADTQMHPNHGMLPKPFPRAAGNLQLSCPMAQPTPRPEGRGAGGV